MPRKLVGIGHGTLDPVFPDPGGPPVTDFLFQSDFGTGTGTGATAVTDNSKWSDGGFTGEVVDAAALDWPSANALRVDAVNDQQSRLYRTGLGTLAIGSRRFHRMYFSIDYPSASPGNSDTQHFIESTDGVNHADNWAIQCWLASLADHWRHYWGISGEGAGSRYRYYLAAGDINTAIELERGKVYRFEWQIYRTGAATMQLHVRIYGPPAEGWSSGAEGVLLYDDDDFYIEDGTQTLANGGDGNPPELVLDDASVMLGINIGHNTVSGHTGSVTYGYQGCVAVRESADADAWCGPYISGEGMS